MGLKQPEFGKTFFKFFKNKLDCAFLFLFRDNIVPGRIDEEIVHILFSLPGLLVHFGNPVHLVPEKFYPDYVIKVTGNDINCISFYSEAPWHEFKVVSLKLDVDQFLKDFLSVNLIPNFKFKTHLLEVFRISQTVDAGHGCHHNHVLP